MKYKIGWESKVTDLIGEGSVWLSRQDVDAEVARLNREYPEIAHFLIDENDEPVDYAPRCLQESAEDVIRVEKVNETAIYESETVRIQIVDEAASKVTALQYRRYRKEAEGNER